ncbi:hypothetical protein R3P38DRAFT_3243317 [Favolaschia claudopus]|uniref:Uncharacterized protein n=1 Tax=Favolaschia claudopus TaxID=2862362 RepID=A0AAV9Z3V4_9AGAR
MHINGILATLYLEAPLQNLASDGRNSTPNIADFGLSFSQGFLPTPPRSVPSSIPHLLDALDNNRYAAQWKSVILATAGNLGGCTPAAFLSACEAFLEWEKETKIRFAFRAVTLRDTVTVRNILTDISGHSFLAFADAAITIRRSFRSILRRLIVDFTVSANAIFFVSPLRAPSLFDARAPYDGAGGGIGARATHRRTDALNPGSHLCLCSWSFVEEMLRAAFLLLALMRVLGWDNVEVEAR